MQKITIYFHLLLYDSNLVPFWFLNGFSLKVSFYFFIFKYLSLNVKIEIYFNIDFFCIYVEEALGTWSGTPWTILVYTVTHTKNHDGVTFLVDKAKKIHVSFIFNNFM